ncbi:unnamed protein product, partial [Rotaria magnacalcarata]
MKLMITRKNDCNVLFIRIFDGDVDEKADSNTTTHILASGECRDVLALKDACPNALIVNIEWLD